MQYQAALAAFSCFNLDKFDTFTPVPSLPENVNHGHDLAAVAEGRWLTSLTNKELISCLASLEKEGSEGMT